MTNISELKKSLVSLGTYTLKNVTSITNLDGYGYSIDLYKGKKYICSVCDLGEPRPKYVVFAYLDKADKKANEDILRGDLKELCEACNVSLPKTYLNNPMKAAEIIYTLLVNLTDMYHAFNDIRTNYMYKTQFAILSTKSNPLRNRVNPNGVILRVPLGHLQPNQYTDCIKAFCEGKSIPRGNITDYILITTPNGNWNMSFKEYASYLLKIKELI